MTPEIWQNYCHSGGSLEVPKYFIRDSNSLHPWSELPGWLSRDGATRSIGVRASFLERFRVGYKILASSLNLLRPAGLKIEVFDQ